MLLLLVTLTASSLGGLCSLLQLSSDVLGSWLLQHPGVSSELLASLSRFTLRHTMCAIPGFLLKSAWNLSRPSLRARKISTMWMTTRSALSGSRRRTAFHLSVVAEASEYTDG